MGLRHRGASHPVLPKSKAPESTLEETNYLQHLTTTSAPVCVKLVTNEELRGVIEFFDSTFLRLTRQDGPNLFIYKHEIKYLYEEPQNA